MSATLDEIELNEAQIWAAHQAELLIEQRCFCIRIALVQAEQDSIYLELEYGEDNIFSIYSTGTGNLDFARSLREVIQEQMQQAGIQVVEGWGEI